MPRTRNYKYAAFAGLLLSSPSFANVLLVNELGMLGTSTAGAGMAATADTAVTAYSNPAGMGYFNKAAITGNLGYLNLKIKYDDDNDPANDVSDAGENMPYGSFYYTQPINDRFVFGVSLASQGGSALDYGNNWVGSRIGTTVDLKTVQLNPAFSYKINDHLFFGAGFSIEYMSVEEKLGTQSNDKMAKLSGDDVGYGGNVGLLYVINDKNRIGFTYRSKIKHSVDSDIDVGDQSLPANVDLDLVDQVKLSGVHGLTHRFDLLWTVGVEFWSGEPNTNITVDGLGQPYEIKRELNDVYQFSLGGRYQITDKLRFEMGGAMKQALKTVQNILMRIFLFQM
ncbi:outer membrane protein transport protein [Vibrio sp. SS-MA-C1-2]|uniref:OmpP1/FadL family transporter n=1 Tax=Vibrio sp. SS-MA-C1-2 TaxID=2908646 RepID=UPI001F3B6900|nr:outer membrane protein transport protein [Vibrio sp. SS-MA-C1-2]UJF17580.1 outer membrane protein transport protein [Vibrio sp. SS-MA-C1-2]